MSEYGDFPKDFISRTLKNLDNYTGSFEVTNLINNCLGLIIIPKQIMNGNISAYKFDDKNSDYGITQKNILYESNEDYSLTNVLRHLRNGLAHGRIEQKSKGKEIVGLRIRDKLNETSSENFVIDFTIDEFRRFAISIATMFSNNSNTNSNS